MHFAEAHRDYRESNSQSQHTSHAANVQETPETTPVTAQALANLASATASDRATVASLTALNEQLIAQDTDLQNKLNEAYAQIHSLCIQNQPNSKSKKYFQNGVIAGLMVLKSKRMEPTQARLVLDVERVTKRKQP